MNQVMMENIGSVGSALHGATAAACWHESSSSADRDSDTQSLDQIYHINIPANRLLGRDSDASRSPSFASGNLTWNLHFEDDLILTIEH